MKPERSEIEKAIVDLTNRNPRYVWGKGELQNAVLEFISTENNLPWTSTEGHEHPDFTNYEIKELLKALEENKDLFK